MRSLIILFFAKLMSGPVYSQIPKKVVVEHFTNTVCSICANRNPGFYDNLNSQSDVLHIAYHPSSPYSSCILNQHNVAENDGRTNYYNVYGSTPRLVIQGEPISAAEDYSSSSIFTAHSGEVSPVRLRIDQEKFTSDSIRVEVSVFTALANGLSNSRLLIGLAEDTIFYSGPNGEDQHYDVFRKALTSITGDTLTLPAVGDSVVIVKKEKAHADWDFTRIYAYALLQEESSKEMIQAKSFDLAEEDFTTNIQTLSGTQINVSPNPVGDFLSVEMSNGKRAAVQLYNYSGQVYLQKTFENQVRLDVSELPSGVYILDLSTRNGERYSRKILKY